MPELRDNNKIERLIAAVASHPQASFYRELWGGKRTFDELPLVTIDDFVRAPLPTRRYKDDISLVKIIHTANGSFLSEWAFEDIAREPFGVISKRPLVYMENSHEALEKSVWCYENGMVPLVGEADPDIAAFAARKYNVDSLITDERALTKLAPYLAEREEMLEAITVIGETFDTRTLQPFTAYARRMRLVRAAAAVGAFAEAEFALEPVFIPVPGCLLVATKEGFTVTKDRPLTTPIIKYYTGDLADTV